jgi:glutamine amidotransferase
MSRIAVIDYGSGNLRSAAKAFERAAGDTGASVMVTRDAEMVRGADRVVLPGVGAFADCRRGLAAVPGLEAALHEAVIERGRPFLGICVGLQLMATRGREFETTEGLDWIAGEVVPIAPADPALKIPHMGWNELVIAAAHPLFADLPAHAHAYFVHSFRFVASAAEDVLASVDYGGPIVAAAGRGNLVGVQFHPEKSQAIGLKVIENFLRWRP